MIKSLIAAAVLISPMVVNAQTPDAVDDAVENIRAAGGSVRVTRSLDGKRATFMTGRVPVDASAATQEARAVRFLEQHGKAFGLRAGGRMEVVRAQSDGMGMEHTRLEQRVKGIPVTGGECSVHVRRNFVTAVHCRLVDDADDVDTTPAVPASEAEEAALASFRRGDATTKVDIVPARLEVFRASHLGAPGGPTALAWRVELVGPGVRQLVWVAARRKVVLLSFNQTPHALSRTVYDAGNTPTLPGTLVRSEGGAATGNVDADHAYDYAGDWYQYFFNTFGRDSYDNAGAPLLSTVDFCDPALPCPLQNAAWSSSLQRMIYGDGFASADDVVAHELTHALTEHTAGLFYYMQSGALNESFSDIFGEVVDQGNGKGSDTPADKWKMGEDLPIGAIRDMANPTTLSTPPQPGRVTDPQFLCANSFGVDEGGVHYNSGVPNKAFQLMVDGGVAYGATHVGIGAAKAAAIEYRALTFYLTSASNFDDDYDALLASCVDLTGTLGITAADCTNAKKALDTTKMKTPWCGTTAPPVARCAANLVTGAPVFTDNFESGLAKWTSGGTAPLWGETLTVWGAPYAVSGVRSLVGIDTETGAFDGWAAMANGVTIPAYGRLQFNHAFGFDDWVYPAPVNHVYFDGGVVEYSANGGPWTDTQGLWLAGARYGTTALTLLNGAPNPLAGRKAFVGESFGFTTTQLNLASLAGQSVRFRFRIGTDDSIGDKGWFIDDVDIYSCQPNLISVGDAPTVAEPGNLPTNTVSQCFAVTTTTTSASAVTAKWTTRPGTGVGGAGTTDFTSASGTVTIPAGQMSSQVCVQVKGDVTNEPTETYSVVLSAPVGAALGDATGVGAITDDGDSEPTISVAGVSVTEGNTGAVNAQVLVKLSKASGKVTWIDFATSDGTALAGSDYTALSASLSIGAGALQRAVPISITGDVLAEANETLNVTISNPVNGTIGVGAAGVTIVDNDNNGTFAFSLPTYVGTEASKKAVLTVTRTGINLASAATVDYATGDGDATAPDDYTATTGTVSFGPKIATATFSVPVRDDLEGELTERFLVQLLNPSANTFVGSLHTALVSITDNEPTVKFSAPAYPAKEGGSATLTVARVGATTGSCMINYATTDGTALANADYTPATGSVTLPAGIGTKTFAVATLQDDDFESVETVNVTLSGGIGCRVPAGTTALVNITDDEPVLKFSAASYPAPEKNANVIVTVQRVGRTGAVQVDFATSDGTALVSDGDYNSTGGTLSFPATAMTRTFAVRVNDDTAAEGNEFLNLTLSNPVGATLGASTAKVVITDNEPTLQLSAATYAGTEGAAATKVTLTVKRVGPVTAVVSANFATSDGTAVLGEDYSGTGGTVSLAVGAASKTFNITILPDSDIEGPETFGVTLTGTSANAGLGALTTATVTIADNEPMVKLALAALSVNEGSPANLVVTRTGPTNTAITVAYNTTDGTAVAPGDYATGNGVLTFPACTTPCVPPACTNPCVMTRTISIPTTTDFVQEADKTFTLSLSGVTGAALGTSTATVTIKNNDIPGLITMKAPAYSVGADGGSVVVTVQRAASPNGADGATVDYQTVAGTATAGSDYTATSGSIVFVGNALTQTVTIPILNDGTPGPAESFQFVLSNPLNGAVLGTPSESTIWVVKE